MGVTVHHGDSREVLKGFADASIDSVVCDPPYALVSIGKRFGAENAAAAKPGKTGAYARASAGFMGQKWDTGETAFDPEFWAEVLRVLKPGGHLLAFSGTRTYHRLACAVEDAGFEIRDMVSWLYGSGFPKSHNVAKQIDKRRLGSSDVDAFKAALSQAVKASGKTRKQINIECGFTMRFDISFAQDPEGWGCSLPTAEQYEVICAVLGLTDDALALSALRDFPRTRMERLYKVVGTQSRTNAPSGVVGAGREGRKVEREITAPGTPEAAAWEGWGTALKPACEPIVLARKPLTGTVAANVLAHGTGALNIDGCRIGVGEGGERVGEPSQARRYANDGATNFAATPGPRGGDAKGRWPANVVYDGSAEVIAAFPDTASGTGAVKKASADGYQGNALGKESRPAGTAMISHGDAGSAARFFYSSKADAADRCGSKHPTVKPIDLMAYLCRLVTPPGGTVLDPFAGSGSTGMACLREGFDCVLIEREAQYVEDIHRRLKHVEGADTPLFSTDAAPQLFGDAA